jgi:hypothetical protein
MVLVVAWAGLFAAGCSVPASPSTPAASIETMSPDWESRFALDWKVGPDGGAARKITGHLTNNYGQTVRVRLLVRALDASGAVIFRRVEQSFSAVPPFERDSFEFSKVPVADRYVVTVYSYENASRS